MVIDAVAVDQWPVGAPFDGWLKAPPIKGFRWAGPDEYRIEPGTDGGRHGSPWLVSREGFATVANEPGSWIDTLSDPHRAGFHRTFARLADRRRETRPASIVRFADRYGWLDPRWPGSGGTTLVSLLRHPNARGPHHLLGEPQGVWDETIFRVAALVTLWDMVRKRDVRGLTRVVELHGGEVLMNCWYVDGKLTHDFPDSQELTLRHFQSPPMPEPFPGAGVIESARAVLFWQINQLLEGEVSPALDPSLGPELRFVPHTLRAAIVLHLAHEISGRRHGPVRCAYLGCARDPYFFPRRKNQRYCSDECRRLRWWHEGRGADRPTVLTVIDGNRDGNREPDSGGRRQT